MKQVSYKPAASRALRRMPANTARRIMDKVDAYASDPESQRNNIKALKGMHAIRLRVGDWRVIMYDGVVLDILDIGPRGSIYD